VFLCFVGAVIVSDFVFFLSMICVNYVNVINNNEKAKKTASFYIILNVVSTMLYLLLSIVCFSFHWNAAIYFVVCILKEKKERWTIKKLLVNKRKKEKKTHQRFFIVANAGMKFEKKVLYIFFSYSLDDSLKSFSLDVTTCRSMHINERITFVVSKYIKIMFVKTSTSKNKKKQSIASDDQTWKRNYFVMMKIGYHTQIQWKYHWL